MRFGIQFKSMVGWLGIIIFVLLSNGVVYAAVIDADTIELAYLFDEGEGDVAKDASRNGRDGAISGAKYVKGKFGTCLEYDGVDDNLIPTDYFGVGGTEPRTTVFWFKAGGTRDHSWVKWGRNAGGEKYYIRAHPSGQECFLRVEVNGGQNYGADDVCDGEWHHCAVVFPEGADSVQDHDLYVDGELQTKRGNDKAMNTDGETQAVNIGARITGHQFMLGLLDELAIFNVDLSETQINAIRKNGLKGSLSVDPQGKLTTSWAMIKTY